MTDPIIAAAQFLATQAEYARHQSWAAEFLSAMHGCAGVVRGLARGPAEQRYLGPCGADVHNDPHAMPCDGDVYARRGAERGTCRTCGATVATAERLAWLNDEVLPSHNFRAIEIEQAFGIRANTLRVWHSRGLLAARGHDTDGKPLFNVGEATQLARDKELSRHERQQRRAERKNRAGAA